MHHVHDNAITWPSKALLKRRTASPFLHQVVVIWVDCKVSSVEFSIWHSRYREQCIWILPQW
jgi:hypothetical protein